MTKKEIFKKAHELTRKMKAEYPSIDYRFQFSLFLKELNAQSKVTHQNNPAIKTGKVQDKLLPRKVVKVGTVERSVGIRYKDGVMYGVLNKTRFIWDKTKHKLPIVDIPDKSKMQTASQLALSFINARLALEHSSYEQKDAV